MKNILVATLVVLATVFVPASTINGQISLTDVEGQWIGGIGGQNVNGLGTNQLSWGITNGQQSGYLFAPTSVMFPVDITLGQEFDLATFTHNNFVIGLGTSIKQATLSTNLNFLIDGEQVDVLREYTFLHNETTNTSPGCCDDIVTAVNNTPFTETFVVGDFEYTFDIKGFRVNGQLMSQFVTEENKANESILVAEINRVPIPEPTTYLLLGSMLALVLLVRRKNKSYQRIKIDKGGRDDC